MYLTSTNLVHYLLASGNVTRHAVVHFPFSVFETDGRNRSFHVAVGAGAGLFVKQLKVADPFSIDCLHREESCYRLAWSDRKFAKWQHLLPRLISYDPVRHIVIVERIADAEELVQCHRRLGSFPLDLARQLGMALADFHTTVGELSQENAATFASRTPWIFRFHDQGREDTSPAVKQLASAVRDDPDMSRQLASLQGLWSSELLIHGDLKWSNCLVAPTSDNTPQLHLVDWEMASMGDPLWDVAGGLAGYLFDPILKPEKYGLRPPTALGNAEFLRMFQPPMQSLWRAYCQHVNLMPVAEFGHAARCVLYLGARLLLTTIEYHQYAHELDDYSHSVLEASRTLLRDPLEMAAIVLGASE